MNEPQQFSFADAEYANKGKVTRREKFLDQLEGLLPWLVMMAVIEPHYASGTGRDRNPFPLYTMLHVHVAQIVYNYSVSGMEDALYEIESLRRFCGIRLEAVPDESTILQFRHLLEAHGLTKQIFAAYSNEIRHRFQFQNHQAFQSKPANGADRPRLCKNAKFVKIISRPINRECR